MTDRLTDEVRARIERHADATGSETPPIPRFELPPVHLPDDVRARIEGCADTGGKS